MSSDPPTRPPTGRPDGPPIYAATARELRLAETFVSLTDTLDPDFDTLGMLTVLCDRSVELLGVTAAGVLLTDGGHEQPSHLSPAVSSDSGGLPETLAESAAVGPGMDCLRTGAPVIVEDLRSERRWPQFRERAGEVGFRAVQLLPMRRRDDAVGVLTLLHTDPSAFEGTEARVGQALADAATIGLLHRRARDRAEDVVRHLERSLSSRVLVEQAKGVVAARTGRRPDDAFVLLRRHARVNGLRLTDLAGRVVDGRVDTRTVLGDPSV